MGAAVGVSVGAAVVVVGLVVVVPASVVVVSAAALVVVPATVVVVPVSVVVVSATVVFVSCLLNLLVEPHTDSVEGADVVVVVAASTQGATSSHLYSQLNRKPLTWQVAPDPHSVS